MKFPKSKTPRDKKYLKYISQQECLLRHDNQCLGEVVPHHIGKGGISIKCSDYETVPVCVFHHDWIHKQGKEWGRDMLERAAKLYKEKWDGKI